MAAADVYLGYSNRIRSHLDVGSQAKSRGNSSAYELALHDASRDAIEALSMLVEDTTFWGGVTSFAGARSNSDVARTITLYLPSLLRQLGMKFPPPPSPEDLADELRKHLKSVAKGNTPSVQVARERLVELRGRIRGLSDSREVVAPAQRQGLWDLLNRAAIITTLATAAAALNSSSPPPHGHGSIVVPLEQGGSVSICTVFPNFARFPPLKEMQEGISSEVLWFSV